MEIVVGVSGGSETIASLDVRSGSDIVISSAVNEAIATTPPVRPGKLNSVKDLAIYSHSTRGHSQWVRNKFWGLTKRFLVIL